MIRLIDGLNPSRAFLHRKLAVSRNDGVFTGRDDRAVVRRIAIHVQNESGDRSVHERCVQQARQ